MNELNSIKKLLTGISGALEDYIHCNGQYGLLTGNCGCALFYAYYYKLTGQKKYLRILNGILEKTVNALAEKELVVSHCNGIAGMAWGIQHLIKNGFINGNETEDIFEELDETLSAAMQQSLGMHQYDFLHEGLGIILYFLEKLPDAAAQTYLEEAVARLQKACIANNAGISWPDNFTQQSGADGASVTYNLGLAHGVPAILNILSMIHEKGIAVNKTRPLIESGVQWMLANKNEPGGDCISLYPVKVTGNNQAVGARQSRLGWCYGDLGIAATLLNIGTRLQNDHYKQHAYTIFKHTLQCRDAENGSIGDACLCHGSMGVSHIYRRAFMATGNDFLLTGADQWLRQTLQLSKWKDGPAGFKYLTRKGYENNNNLLEGITGIGLALIAAVDADTSPAWDRCLLLS